MLSFLATQASGAGAAGLAWEQQPGFRRAPLSVPAGGRDGFRLLTPAETGVRFTNELAHFSAAQNRILENGSGVALGDIDGDGWCDIYFCRLEGDNVLYRNLGNWTFEDITSKAGVGCPDQYSTGALLADADGDGDLDLFVNAMGSGTRCFLNDGAGRFTEQVQSRLVRRFSPMSMAMADVDGDGDLELYVANYSTTTYRDNPPGLKVEARRVDGRIVVTPPDRFIPIAPRDGAMEVIEMGERDYFYMNGGGANFLPVSWTNGAFLDVEGRRLTAPPRGWGLSVMFRDLNQDRLPDLYVCNDFFYFGDDVFLNVDGTSFRAISTREMPHGSLSSMAVDAADLNRDGWDDFFVADMVSRQHSWRHRQRPDLMGGRLPLPVWDPLFRPEVPRNTLFLNRGDHTWVDVAPFSGLENTEWTWGAVFLDVDLDGWEDLLIANGNDHDVQDADTLRAQAQLREEPSPQSRARALSRFARLDVRNLAFRNQHDLTFADRSGDWGFDLLGISHGMALADLDNDGDLDVVINNLHSNASLYRNESAKPRIAVRLRGDLANTRGIGARITLSGDGLPQSQEMICGGRYLSSDDPIRTFAALPSTPGVSRTLEVVWRSGRRSVVRNPLPNSLYEIDERAASPPAAPSPRAPLASGPIRFQDVSQWLGHTHVDQEFNDFARQPLMSHSLSHRGPGVAWADVDGDGWEDLAVGSGRGGILSVFRNVGGAGFTNVTSTNAPLTLWDQSGLVSWASPSNGAVWLAGTMNYEETGAIASSALGFTRDGLPVTVGLEGWDASTGPLALGDVDGDGDLDLFVGGRVIPGRYPEACESRIYRWDQGRWNRDSAAASLLQKAGLVSGAIFTDLNSDGMPELVLACEWGPLRVLELKGGAWREITDALGLSAYSGWWNGVAAGDVDGDGQLDLIASNWGRNGRFHPTATEPVEILFADFLERGTVSCLETYFVPEMKAQAPWRDWELVTREMPWVRERISTYREFGTATAQVILGEHAAKAGRLAVTTLDSTVFLNRGGRFEARPLPIEAQFSPAFAVCVADFDADGIEDIFLGQNFFGVTLETARFDGGRGLLLRGTGKGGLLPVECGIKVSGEQRGAAVADFDHDGRPDLVVAQNRGGTRLFRNTGERAGLRVTLKGPPANPRAIGAVIRAHDGSAWGPARGLHAGGGYWSQDASIQVLGSAGTSRRVSVRWPGGTTTLHDIPPGAREVTLEFKTP